MKVLLRLLLVGILQLSSCSISYGWVSSTPSLPRSPPVNAQHHLLSSCTTSTNILSFDTRVVLFKNSFHLLVSYNKQQHSYRRITSLCSTSSDSSSDEIDATNDDKDNTGIDLSSDPRLYKVRLSRATGIDWGTDLSFSFVYIRAMDPTGAAALSGVVAVNDQLCEVTPYSSTSTTTSSTNDSTNESNSNDSDNTPTATATQPINLIGAPFDYVMDTFATLDRNVKELDFVFFRGSRDELKSICTGSTTLAGDGSDMITVTVVENKGSSTEMIRQLRAPAGVNVRELLVNNNINVYQSITRWTNCKGKQLCGTCIVNIPTGGRYTNRKSMDEASTLRENPESYRLSCVSFAYGDITVETFPPINAAQWTR